MPSASAFLDEPERKSASAFLDEGQAAPSAAAFLDEAPSVVSGGHTSVAPPAPTPTAKPGFLQKMMTPRTHFAEKMAAEREQFRGKGGVPGDVLRGIGESGAELVDAMTSNVGIAGVPLSIAASLTPWGRAALAGTGAYMGSQSAESGMKDVFSGDPALIGRGLGRVVTGAGMLAGLARPKTAPGAARPAAAPARLAPPAAEPAPATPRPEIGPQIVTERAGLPAGVTEQTKPTGIVADIIARHEQTGGSSTRLRTGENLAGRKEYAVSPYKDLETIIEGPVTPKAITDFTAKARAKHPELLDEESAAIGTWKDPETGKSYIDLIVTTPDKAKAFEIGRGADQKAVTALDTLETFPVPKILRFEHYTDQPGLERLTAERYGQGALSASEKARQSPPGVYLYKEGARAEPKVLGRAKEKVTVEIPEDQIGDISKMEGLPTEREAALAAEGKTYVGPEYPDIYKSFAKELKVVGREPVLPATQPVRGMPGIELVNPKTGELIRTIQPQGNHVSGLGELSAAERAAILAGRIELRAGRFDANGRVEANPTTTTRFHEYLDTLAKRDQATGADAARLQGVQPLPGKPGPVADMAGPARGNPPERIRAQMGAPPGREPVAPPDNVRKGGGGEPPAQPPPPTGVGPEFVTSARQEMMAQDRAALGLDIPEEQGGRTWRQAMAAAQAQQIPERAMDVAHDLASNPRALSDVESAGLVIRANDLKNQHAAAMQKVGQAADPAEIRMASAEVERIEQDFEALSQALNDAGSEVGRALAARKLTINQDFQLISVLNRAKAAKGGPLSAKERTRFETLVRQIEDMTNQLKTGTFTPKAAKPRPAVPKEIERLEFQRDVLQRQIRDQINSLKPKTVWGRTSEPLNAARAIMTSEDFSGVGRQGGFIVIGNPVRGARALGPMFKAFASPQAMWKMEKALLARPNAPLYARAKLHLSELDHPSLSMQEEVFMSQLIKKIPGVYASARAYTMFLNRLRADSFDAMMASFTRNGQATEVEARAIANFINVATGRGSLGQFEEAATGLNSILFAPRYVASRFQLLAGQPFYKGTARTRALIAKEYGKYLVGMGVIYGLGAAAGGTIEVDPRSADFGKIRFGNTRLDPLSGLSQVAVLMSRLVSGKTKKPGGELAAIRGPEKKYGQAGAVDIITRFGRSKLSPPVAAAVNVMQGEMIMGEEATPASIGAGLVTPLAPKDVYEAIKEQGVVPGVAMGLFGLFGWGLQTYEARTRRAGHAGPFAFFQGKK